MLICPQIASNRLSRSNGVRRSIGHSNLQVRIGENNGVGKWIVNGKMIKQYLPHRQNAVPVKFTPIR